VSLDHLLREPEGGAQGVLILNHGRGTTEHDLYGLLDELDPERRFLGVTPGAPLTAEDVAARSAFPVGPGGRHWYAIRRVGFPDPETFAIAYERLARFLDDLLEARGLGWDRALVGGFSMGAVMSYAIGLGPGRPMPGGILALSGFVPTVEGWRPDLEGRAGLPVLIHHGRADPVIGVDFGRAAARLLDQGGLAVDYIESSAGHWVPPELAPRLRSFVASVLAPSEAQA
jgi:phospholipase/carboxylesterase